MQAALEARGIAARRPVFRPVHQALGLDGYPEAERLWSSMLSIPCYPALADAEVEQVADAVLGVLRS
jgi:dTDP-4-amino-4,6-dideoxygalactose transaminase